jgi:hypothetical protein
MNIPNIAYRGDISKVIIAEDNNYELISYYRTIDDFIDYQAYTKFIGEVEKLVRTSNEYKAFITYIKRTLGVSFCQVFSKINDDLDATIEAHHGPIFTLYDICEIILNWFLKTGQRVNSFRVANKVLDEHFALRVGIVMLSKTAHEMLHNNDLFINVDQCIGNTNAFIEMYNPYFSNEQKYKIWNYINICKQHKSFDRGILDLEHVSKQIRVE